MQVLKKVVNTPKSRVDEQSFYRLEQRDLEGKPLKEVLGGSQPPSMVREGKRNGWVLDVWGLLIV